jgi:hypothetical protein
MDALELFRARMTATKEGTREGAIENSKRVIAEDFERNPSVESVLGTDIKKEPVAFRLVSSRKRGSVEQFTLHPYDSADCGTVFHYDAHDYIITERFNVGNITTRLRSHKVNFELKWRKLNGDVVTTKAASLQPLGKNGEEHNPYLVLPSTSRAIVLPRDTDVEQIKREKRLMVDRQPYQVVKVDNLEYENCVVVTLDEIIKTDYDSEDVCDFFLPTPGPVDYRRIDGKPEIYRGQSQEFRLKIGESTVLTDVDWSIDDPDFVLSVSNGVATVLAPEKKIGKTAVLTVNNLGMINTLVVSCRSLV